MIGLSEEEISKIATEVFDSTPYLSLGDNKEKTIKAIVKVVSENNKAIYEQIEKMTKHDRHK